MEITDKLVTRIMIGLFVVYLIVSSLFFLELYYSYSSEYNSVYECLFVEGRIVDFLGPIAVATLPPGTFYLERALSPKINPGRLVSKNVGRHPLRAPTSSQDAICARATSQALRKTVWVILGHRTPSGMRSRPPKLKRMAIRNLSLLL